ncbi:T9SS type A sorting domain-containing protein [Chryseosolibacter indicus]|uniref:T9SS type A sorting domain-containing protein n=1 Tax=Chryseosolibacter indicus TaxID=2782351 RepID=A0ABS5VT49_9BACT|nr:T9SS type A sorting domain-containing protein [Chryseosolibacter indicus]MBT1704604.1 T9SS type A sorting domain-containing protein [Chryseosolibacter indicus]
MKTPLPSFTVTTLSLLLVCYDKADALNNHPGSISQTSELEAPAFRPPEYPAFENDLIFGVFNPNYESFTEVYRSRNRNSEYELVATIPYSDDHYLDRDLRPNTTYFYKLRAVQDTLFSDYSNVLELTTGYKLFAPSLTATAISSTSISLQLTDNSYNDVSYVIWREEATQAFNVKSISAPDSGEVFTIVDENLKPNTTYNYRVDVHAQGPGNVFYPGMVRAVATTPPPTQLTTPEFGPPGEPVCGSVIAFGYINTNPESETEIYRSLTEDDDFEVIYVSAPGSGTYIDEDVKPRTTYYYKLRAIGEIDSEFSNTVVLTSGSDFYNPGLTATAASNTSIALKITDRSYLDGSYEIFRAETGSNNYTYLDEIILSDSGQTYSHIDEGLAPNKSYTYRLDARAGCEGLPTYYNVATATASTTNLPEVTSFTLVQPLNEEDIMELYDGVSFSAVGQPNIRANTNNRTQSLVFYLNGKRYGENQTPYALFGDWQGDYRPGKLKPGSYTLTAIPYGENNASGIQGDSLTIHFTVIAENINAFAANEFNTSGSSEPVSVFPNPIVTQSTIAVQGEAYSTISINITEQAGNLSHTLHHGILDNNGVYKKNIDAINFKQGAYVVTVKINEQIYSKRLIIK